MGSDKEIERKFLIASKPGDLDSYPVEEIEQGYLTVGEVGEVRLRRKGSRFYLTAKQGEGLIRREAEVELEPQQFAVLWPLTEGRRVGKNRYTLRVETGVLEIDVYKGELEGLCLGEVEFSSAAEAEGFRPPTWFGKEVTWDERYKNKNLALHGLPEAPK